MGKAIGVYLAPDVVHHFPGVDAKGHDGYWNFISQNVTDEVRAWHVLEGFSFDSQDGNSAVVECIGALGEKPDGQVHARQRDIPGHRREDRRGLGDGGSGD